MAATVGLAFSKEEAAGKAGEPTKAELLARAEALGIEVPPRATKADIEALVEGAE